MKRKQRKGALVAGRGGKKCTESLKDLLGSVGINGTNDWLDYVNKIAVLVKSPHECEKLVEGSEENLSKNSGKQILFPPLPSMDKRSRKIKNMKLEIKKLFEPELQKADVPEKKNRIFQALGNFFLILFDQGPIEQISCLVFTIFTMIKWAILKLEIKPSIKDGPQDKATSPLVERMAPLCSNRHRPSINERTKHKNHKF
ncbi:uncharacterized protein LOC119547702 isoform X2 [Drosophila subpulchrella]|uniref:uncharacterized protein LOC119547702 isoform X2 n=1 Tax=Drosophila subpulchrella TaxID=1486046 RepID=UPI0018A13817|nr:uncharacterized protein LOC119547702 isoform X2 [Drosophila subpulchrella]